MEQCCACFARAGRSGISFANSPMMALGDNKIPSNRRLPLGIIFPHDTGVSPLYMFFNKSNEGIKVLEAACSTAGIKLDRGKIVGSPERLNLFTTDGDILRIDLDLEAHLGTTLLPNAWIVVEKGNRVDPTRLALIREMKRDVDSGGGCAIM